MHWNNCQDFDPFREKLSPLWYGWWTTPTGEKIHAKVNFALYWEILRVRNDEIDTRKISRSA